MDEVKLVRTILRILQFLVGAQYAELATFAQSDSLTPLQIEKAVETWPYPLVMPLGRRLQDLIYDEALEIAATSPTQWSVYVNLWTRHEGRSDLTLEVTIYDCPGEYYGFRIDNIHVL